MARGNQREQAREKNLKKQAAKNQGDQRGGHVHDRNSSDKAALEAKVAAKKAAKEAEAAAARVAADKANAEAVAAAERRRSPESLGAQPESKPKHRNEHGGQDLQFHLPWAGGREAGSGTGACDRHRLETESRSGPN